MSSVRDRLHVFASFTKSLASLSKCTERQVAAIIVDEDFTQVLSIGINGGPRHGADCLCVTEGKYGCVHAEINALVKCTDTRLKKIMICSLAPCKACAAAIVNAPGGFKAVYYLNKWKSTSGIELLEESRITTIHLDVL